MKEMTTQRVNASYQEIIDLHTESDRVSILGFHTPANEQPVNMLRPFWQAYQKVRYLGCSMSLVPAARLPADPSQVSYEAGEQVIDPRDLLNPILFHGCHGDDMGSILNQFYAGEDGSGTDIERLFSDSMDYNMVQKRIGDDFVYESLYYRALTDNTWLKAHPQRGFRKNMRPMVYRVATNTALNPSSAGSRQPKIAAERTSTWVGVDDGERSVGQRGILGPNTGTSTSQMITTPSAGLQTTSTSGGNVIVQNPVTFSAQGWMTPGIMPLGWIDTRQVSTGATGYASLTGESEYDALALGDMYEGINGRYCLIPKVFMGICLLPPAYKQELYFRIVLNHHFAFAKYRGTSMRYGGQSAGAGNVVNMNGSENSKKVVDDGESKDVLDD